MRGGGEGEGLGVERLKQGERCKGIQPEGLRGMKIRNKREDSKRG